MTEFIFDIDGGGGGGEGGQRGDYDTRLTF